MLVLLSSGSSSGKLFRNACDWLSKGRLPVMMNNSSIWFFDGVSSILNRRHSASARPASVFWSDPDD